MTNYLQKVFYKSDMKMLIRIAKWSPQNPRPFSFTYQSSTNTDRMVVSCDAQGVLTLKFNNQLLDNAVQMCDQGVRIFKDYPHFQPGRLTVLRSYPQVDSRYSDGEFNSISPELTTIQIAEINDTSTMESEVEEYVEQLKGEPGISAYEAAKSKGYDRGEEQFAQEMVLAANAAQKCNYGQSAPFITGDKFYGKLGEIKDVWSTTIEVNGVLAESNSKAVYVKTSSLAIDTILSVRGCFYTSASQAIFPIGMMPNPDINLFCDSNGTNFYTNIIMPVSYVGKQCRAYVNVLYTI